MPSPLTIPRRDPGTAPAHAVTPPPDLAGARAVVVGLGVSGLAAARFLAARGARVVGNDRRTEAELPEATRSELEARGAELRLGGHPESVFQGADLVVVSPGVPPLAEVERASSHGVPVWSELELASRYLLAPVVAITGTNGKSTVTSLVGEAARAAGRPVFVGGNLGVPLVDAVDHPGNRPDGLVVVEASSFQLERVDAFRPTVAALLNLSEDHLDRYSSFAAYGAAKSRLFHAQGPEDVAVVPSGDLLCLAIARGGRGRVVTFGGHAGAVRVVGGALVGNGGGFHLPLRSLALAGQHNVDNAAAAAVCALAAGLPEPAVAEALAVFPGLPHRMARVGEVDGVVFYDDSKATNVGAALAALAGLDQDPRVRGRVVLLLGGVDKGGSYATLRQRVEAGGHAVVLFGAATPRIAAAFAGSGVPLRSADGGGLDAAFAAARELARPGDAVLLAPACASFDEFTSYAARGRRFAELVSEASGSGATGGSSPAGEVEA